MADILRAATYNLHSCVGSDRRYDPERSLKVLREIDADVLALQEIGGYLHNGLEHIAFFKTQLNVQAILGPNLFRKGVPYGNAVLVRNTIRESRLVDLTVAPFEPRSAIDAVIDTPAGAIRVVATHLGLIRRERRFQISCLAVALAQAPQPLTLVLGDFNIFGLERTALQRIGASRKMPRLYTFPTRLPLLSLDRIWTIPNECLINIAAHRTPLARVASDHLPVVAAIAWRCPTRNGT